jgi:UDP-N-acetylmuramoyl-L-alanyl-D-glutamate--2,6-diaminopimelate ligase
VEAYAGAKQRLFHLPGLKHALINADDPYGRRFLASLPPGVQGCAYGLDGPASALHIWGSALSYTATGLSMHVHTPWGAARLQSRLLGAFNARNLLAVLGTLLLNGVSLTDAIIRLGRLSTVSGRMEMFSAGAHRPLVVVDYAHTPDALEQVLQALRPHCSGQLYCVFGCGGERDAGKRPLMGEVVERLADRAVVTDDNPRHEDGDAIVQAILDGMTRPERAWMERDRARAIVLAIHEARGGDVVLIAGKGHECFQQVGNSQIPFSDRAQVEALGFTPTGELKWCA